MTKRVSCVYQFMYSWAPSSAAGKPNAKIRLRKNRIFIDSFASGSSRVYHSAFFTLERHGRIHTALSGWPLGPMLSLLVVHLVSLEGRKEK
jgi:hypothetical protein